MKQEKPKPSLPKKTEKKLPSKLDNKTDEEVIKLLRETKEETLQIIEQYSMQSHSGPLPTPEDLDRYETILPGLANRIACMAENEQSYRHESHRADQKTNRLWVKLSSAIAFSGQLCALVITLGFLYLGFESLKVGNSLVGVGSMLGAAGALVAAFLGGRKSNDKLGDKKK